MFKNISIEVKMIFSVSIIYLFSYIIEHPIGCLIYRVTGIECPGCGMTTAWYWLIKGDVSKAFYYHPLFIIPLIAVIIYIINLKFKKIKHYNLILILLFSSMIVLYVIRIIFDIEMFVPLDTEFNLFNMF